MDKDTEKNLRGQIRKLRKQVSRLKYDCWRVDRDSQGWGFLIDELAKKVFGDDKKGLWQLYMRYCRKRTEMEAPEIYRAICEAEQQDMEQRLQSVQDGVTSMMEDKDDEQ